MPWKWRFEPRNPTIKRNSQKDHPLGLNTLLQTERANTCQIAPESESLYSYWLQNKLALPYRLLNIKSENELVKTFSFCQHIWRVTKRILSPHRTISAFQHPPASLGINIKAPLLKKTGWEGDMSLDGHRNFTITNSLLKWKAETKSIRKAGARPPRSEHEADPSQARTNHKAGQKPSLVLFSLDCLKVLPRNRRIPLNRYLPQLSIWGLWQAALPLCVWPMEHVEWLRLAKWEKTEGHFFRWK